MQRNIFDTEQRFKLIHTMTGQTVARANNLEAFRGMIDRDEARYFTLHDLRDGKFSGASIIFKDAIEH
jgi:hypothetical protein